MPCTRASVCMHVAPRGHSSCVIHFVSIFFLIGSLTGLELALQDREALGNHQHVSTSPVLRVHTCIATSNFSLVGLGDQVFAFSGQTYYWESSLLPSRYTLQFRISLSSVPFIYIMHAQATFRICVMKWVKGTRTNLMKSMIDRSTASS